MAAVAVLSETLVAHGFQWTSTAQLVFWALIAVGLLLHSRTSALIALAAVCGCVMTANLWPGREDTVSDPRFLYNMLPLVLALGGHYLTLDRVTIGWIVAVSVGMIVVWPMFGEASMLGGLPLFCLPFNLVFLGSLVAFRGSRRLVPLELAVTSPLEVRFVAAPAGDRGGMLAADRSGPGSFGLIRIFSPLPPALRGRWVGGEGGDSEPARIAKFREGR